MKIPTLVAAMLLALATTPAQAAPLAQHCNPVAVVTCGLPFPSDLFRDEVTQQLQFDDAIIDTTSAGPVRQAKPLLSQMDPAFRPSLIFNGSSGFSAVGPILFELPAAPAGVIPKDGGELAVVFDLDTGERIDMVAEISMAARNPLDPAKASHVIQLWPRSRLQFGHRYVAALTTQLKMAGNADFARSRGMEVALGMAPAQSDADSRLYAAYGESRDVLARNGIGEAQVLSATFFTVRTEAEVTGPLFAMAQYIASQPLKISGLAPGEPLGSTPYSLGTLYGRVDLVNFRDASGAVRYPYRPVPLPSQENVEVLLTVPRVDAGTSTPIALWGHGVGNQKEVTRTGFDRNDAAGIVSIAIDHPNHGSRATLLKKNQENFRRISANPKQVMATLGVYVQASLDQVALMTAVRNSINEAFDAARPALPGLAPVDTGRMVYHSLSFGSMIGVAATAVSNDVLGAFFLSGCGGLMHIMSTTLFWEGNKQAFPAAASGAEVMFQIAMMQHYVDIADGLNFAHYYRNPPPGYTQKRVVMQYAIDDGNIVNEISEAQAMVMDLPLLDRVYRATPWLRFGSEGLDRFEDGYGIYQLPFLVPNAEQMLADAALTQQQLDATAALYGKTLSFSLVELVYKLIYSDYNRFMVHLTTAIPESMRKNRAWNCEILQTSPELCVRGIPVSTESP